MPLYERKGGKDAKPQRVRTVRDSSTDERLAADKAWQLVDETKTKPAGGDERTGSGTATVTVGQNGGS